jgi:hypothetical protein
VREALVDEAEAQLAGTWNGIARILPTQDARDAIFAALDASR